MIYSVTRTELILYGVIVVVIVLRCYFKWSLRRFEQLSDKLPGPPSYPIVGSMFNILSSSEDYFKSVLKLGNEFSPEPFKIWIGSFFIVVIMKPEDIQIVLNSSKALEKPSFGRIIKYTAGDGLLISSVDKWRKHRRIVSSAFNSIMLDNFIPIFNEKNQILIRNLENEVGKEQPFDLWNYISSMTVDTICQTAMGHNLDRKSKDSSDFTNALTKLLELDIMRIFKPWLYPDIAYLIYLRLTKQHILHENLIKLPKKVIKEKKERYFQKKMENNADVIDVTDDEKKQLKILLDKLLEFDQVGEHLTDDEIRDEVMTFMFAGSDTTAVNICSCLLLLAIHPDIQDRVYDEIYNVLGDGDDPILIEDTTKLVYLEQVLKETLRLFPVIALIYRKLLDDVKIASGDFVLPKGTTCIVSPVAVHHLPDIYINPWSFNPENFNPENVAKRHKYSFIPFSSGQRGCIGAKYAMLSMKVSVAMILRNFSVHTDWTLNDIKLKLDIILRSVNGYPVTIRRRDRTPMCKKKIES